MCSIVEAVGDVVGGAIETVGDVAASVGDVVVREVVKPLVKAVDSTVESAKKNPVGTFARVGLAYAGMPQFLPLISAAETAANGGNVGQIVSNAGISYIAGQIGSEVGTSGLSQAVSAGAACSAMRGEDIRQGALAGGINYGVNSAMDSLFSSANAELNQPPDRSDFAYKLPGSDLDIDRSWQSDYDMNPADYSFGKAPGYSSLTMDSIKGQAPSLNRMNGAAGLTIPTEGGVLSSAGFTSSGAMPALGDPRSFINDENVTGQPAKPIPSCFYDIKAPRAKASSVLGGARQPMCMTAISGVDIGIPWLNTEEQMLHNARPVVYEGDSSSFGDQANLRNIYAETPLNFRPLDPYEVTSKESGMSGGGAVSHFESGGSTGYCSTWGPMGSYRPKFYESESRVLQSSPGKGQRLALAQLKQLQSHISCGGNMGGMAKGGLPSKKEDSANGGHNPEFVTGLTGYYACGGGTGQSDDIDAMLYEGDYVMDADSVSALGDGSSKAGRDVLLGFLKQIPYDNNERGKPVPAKIADGEVVFPGAFVTALGSGDNKAGSKILDGLRGKLRSHKRSAPTSRIPPKAKSPLEYIESNKD